MLVISQILAAESYPFFTHGPVERYRGTQRLELMGRKGMVSIFWKQSCCLSVTPELKY